MHSDETYLFSIHGVAETLHCCMLSQRTQKNSSLAPQTPRDLTLFADHKVVDKVMPRMPIYSLFDIRTAHPNPAHHKVWCYSNMIQKGHGTGAKGGNTPEDVKSTCVESLLLIVLKSCMLRSANANLRTFQIAAHLVSQNILRTDSRCSPF